MLKKMNGVRALCYGNVFCNHNFLKIHTFPQAKPSAVTQPTFTDTYRGKKRKNPLQSKNESSMTKVFFQNPHSYYKRAISVQKRKI